MNIVNITAIVCAFNKERTIECVIDTLIDLPSIDQLIIIDDGSTDQTRMKLGRYSDNPKFNLIINSSNKGKGYGMAEGILKAKNDLLLFVDAGLINLTSDHVQCLLAVLIYKKADMVIGHPVNTVLGHRHNPFKNLSGQRVLYKKDIYPIVDKMKDSRFSVETLINLYYKANRKHTIIVPLKELTNSIKTQKHHFFIAIREFVHEAFQIGKTIVINKRLIKSCLSNHFRN